MKSNRKWLITGGCGFIGTNLIERLRADGTSIRVLDNLSVGSRETLAAVSDFDEISPDSDWSPGVQLVVGDIREATGWAEAFEGVDVVVHLAASTGVPQSVEDPMHDCTSNVVGLLNVLEAARNAKAGRFIFASSGAPAGEVEPPIHEEVVPRPVSPYGASKLAGEAYCSAYARTFGLGTVALRFGNVYGPRSGHKSSVVAKWVRLALEGSPIEIYGDGNATRDFIFTSDLVEAIVRATDAEPGVVAGEVFQIATSRETTVGELAHVICDRLEAVGIPRPDVRFSAERLGDVPRNYSDTSKAKERLGWVPRMQLADGLDVVIDSLRSSIGVGSSHGVPE
ncbi:MAG: NAD-dependent epimerase/dehydratase family protein [Phycisphaera sp.]|nr:NAD-dependent epimerase/dehydratase family protein [Phycisphaera sp.]